MIAPVLFLILTGSFATSLAMAFQGASIGKILLGYVAGGWAGLLIGLPLLLGVRALWHLLPKPEFSGSGRMRP